MNKHSTSLPEVSLPPASEQNPAAPCDQGIDFGALFKAIPAPYLVISPQFIIMAANAAYLQIAGRRSEDIVGRMLFDAFPDNPNDPQAAGVANLRASLLQVLETGRVDKMAIQRYDVATEAGGDVYQTRYWRPVNTPVLDAAGGVTCIIQSVEEMTGAYMAQARSLRDVLSELTDTIRDLKTAEEIGYAAATLLGQALGASRVGYGTIEPGSDTLVVVRDWCAPGIASAAGSTALRSYGSFIDDLKLDRFIAIDNVDEDPRTAQAATALRAHSAAAFVNVPLVEDGVLSAILYVNNVHPRGWTSEELVLIKEVAARLRAGSERARSVAALRESEAKFRTIADAMPQMVWSTLPDGFHDYYNEQWYRYTGMPLHSTDGDGWNGIFHPDDQERAWKTWRTSLETGKPYEIQYRLRHHSGVYRWVLGRALPIRGDEGQIIRWMGTCTDIDSQKHAEDELRNASRSKDEFLAMLAHELRNPLAPINNAAQLLVVRHEDNERVRKTGEIILRQVRHLTNLVDDLLDVSRVTRGLVEIERVPLDLKEVLQGAVEQARPLIEARRHQLTVELTPARTWISGDKTRLVQVIANLLNNAAKYTPQGGHITLSLETAEQEACIMVTDNGNGIAPSLLPYVFDLFTQAERTPDRTQGGLGLGLALVKRITALHEGSVHALSDGLGQGSSFLTVLPLLDAPGTAHGGETADDGASSGLPAGTETPARAATTRVMIVDDHVDGMRSLAALLEEEGHEVLMAEDGASGLRTAAGRTIDTFILDIGLPDMDGYELARRLRASDEGRNALLIALTGYGQPQDRLRSKAAGFDHHFVKPVDISVLIRIMAQQVEDAPSRTSHERD
ncbi:MAG: ATP-binding protein [Telluria sp.]